MGCREKPAATFTHARLLATTAWYLPSRKASSARPRTRSCWMPTWPRSKARSRTRRRVELTTMTGTCTMSSRGSGISVSANAGTRAAFSTRLPSAASIERRDQHNGIYDLDPTGVEIESTMPTVHEHMAHYARTLAGRPEFQAAVNAIHAHWDEAKAGYRLDGPNVFEQPATRAEAAVYALFRAYDSVSRHAAMQPLTERGQKAPDLQ